MSSGRLPDGTLIDDRYEIVEILGKGGFGEVYRARQKVFGRKLRDVAFKRFTVESVTQGNFLDVFNDVIVLVDLQEIDPPPDIAKHLIKVYDMGAFQKPSPGFYMAMQLVPGRKTLGHVIRRHSESGGMPVTTSLMFLRQILVPLAWMHTLDYPVVHGDIKPDNLLLKGESTLILTDFGLAARLPFGSQGGTPEYQAPESLAGLSSNTEADIYAIGIIWYEMLTGQHPFNEVGLKERGDDDQQGYVLAHRKARKQMQSGANVIIPDNSRVHPASDINEELKQHPQLEVLLNRCLSYRQTQRPANAAILLKELNAYLETGRIQDIDIIIDPQQNVEVVGPVIIGNKTAEMLVHDAKTLFASGQTEQALKLGMSAMEKDPHMIPAQLLCVRALTKLKQLKQAMQMCKEAIKMISKEPEAYYVLAEVYDAEGQPQMAKNMRKHAKSLEENIR